ncbi:MAG: MBL fold metallo-hydrolase [Ruminococcus sp.]|nr:MBL fold metallo-hydrolase [Ruminococcus sp.]
MLKEQILSTKLTDGQIAVFYLGQEGFLIKYKNKYIFTDPYLSDYVDKHCCNETVQWIRTYDAPIDGSELDFVDYIFCSHPHLDHADPQTLGAINSVNKKAKYIVPFALKKDLISYGIDASQIICAEADEEILLDDIRVLPIPAAHEELQKNEDGHYDSLGFIIQLGNIRLYHAGDCCIYDGLKDRLTNIDIGFLPINGRDYYRLNYQDIIGNMDSREAILLAKETDIKLLVPTHYDLYEVNDVNPAYFVDCLFKFNRTQQFHMFVPGERFIFSK